MTECDRMGCSQSRYGENCAYKNCKFHPHYDEQYVTKNLCHHPKTWWICSNCGGVTCRGCHAFKLPTVTFCINCYEDWLKKKNITTKEQFDKKIKHYASIGQKMYDACIASFAMPLTAPLARTEAVRPLEKAKK